ncbi:hypothetical protein CLV46_2633 [Diaminobutyricimonas aerilata]|uniref:DNA modification methylase n=1 Tax=Diaminobutyricimonas aerilata TaxID=1162967 RepID=A0A2M9CMB9_9MICO|nr:hypothetical protein [Diaminobutyricimonas aerilata]PJJ73051.1 hypothetical protein CLV46_2633 [Diaminobutyricimonas aerilata]
MRARAAASVALAGIIAVMSAGCAFVTPQATQEINDVVDGASGRVGDVAIENALAITEDGETVNVVFSVVNESDDNVRLDISYDEGSVQLSEQVWVDAGEQKTIGVPGDRQVIFEGVDAPLGSLMPVYVQYGDAEGNELMLPVLDGRLDEYRDLLPTPQPTVDPSPTPTNTPTPFPTPDGDTEDSPGDETDTEEE